MARQTTNGDDAKTEQSQSSASIDDNPFLDDLESGQQHHMQEETKSDRVPTPGIGSDENEEPSFLLELKNIVREKNEATFATWYNENGKAINEYSFHSLWEEAGIIAYYLREKWNVKKGYRVVLCYNFGLHFFASFLGCLRAGVTAVLVYPPERPLAKSLTKMNKVVSDCTPSLILIDSDVMLLRNTDRLNLMSKSHNMWPQSVEYKVTDKLINTMPATSSSIFAFLKRKTDRCGETYRFDEPNAQPDDIAFLQYTSGSTGDPKGVMVTFSALQANVRLIRNGFTTCYKNDGGMPPEMVGFSWLPQYHDLGLIYAAISPFASGWRMHMMSPITFIKKPLLWLELMSRLRVSWGVAPDFAYNLVVRKYLDAKAKPNLDLSAIHNLQNGSEPIRHDTYTNFYQAFSHVGLRKNWFHAGYGMAENVVGVCWVHSYTLSSPNGAGGNCAQVAIGSRHTFDESLTVKIVSQDEAEEVADGEVGEIWLSGPSVAAGYFGKHELSKEVFCAKLSGCQQSFLQTGDLGFFENDHLFICGRIKDLIIVNGTNYYPQDIEMEVQDALPAVRPGCIAAFSRDDTSDDGFVEVVFEIRKDSAKDAADICRIVQAAIADATGLQATRVTAIVEKTIPKTTSGKIRRKATRAALHAGELRVIHDLECSSESCLNEDKVLRRLSVTRSRSWHSTGSSIPMKLIDPRRRSTIGSEREYFPRKNNMGMSDRLDGDFHENIKKVYTSKNYEGDPDDEFFKILWSVLSIQPIAGKQDIPWNELGLTSITSAELQNELTMHYSVELSVDCFEQYRTPALLKQHLLKSRNELFPIHAPDLERRVGTQQISWLQMSALQTLAAVILLLMFSLPIVPAWYVGKALTQSGCFTYFTVNGTLIKWFWFPCVIPTWMVCFTIIVIISKWVVVGRYREQEILVQSISYLRWWFVDRAVHMWEFWVGRFITDTVLLWLFNRLMGANVHISAELKATIREYDLVKIGPECSIKHPICCRRFGPWEEEKGPSLRFQKIEVGNNTNVKGMLSLGCNIGENSCVKRLSVVDEGAQVPPGTRAVGNPAFNGGKVSNPYKRCRWWKYLEALKLVWIFTELYLYFSALLVSQIIWNGRLPATFRYSPLLYWVLLIGTSSIVLLVHSMILKWLLIGRRKPGPFKKCLWRSFAEWSVDYQFRISIQPLLPFTEQSRIWNVVFKLIGMQVDLFSKLGPEHIYPSGVDLLCLEKAFITAFTFDSDSSGSYHQISLVRCNIGIYSHIEAGTKIEGKKIPPISCVSGMIHGNEMQGVNMNTSLTQVLYHEALLIILYAIWFGLFMAGLVPAYEAWNLFDYQSMYEVLLSLPFALVVQTVTWIIIMFFLELITFLRSTERSKPWNVPLYLVYHSANTYILRWSFIHLIWGTLIFSPILSLLGADIKGRLLFFGRATYDSPYVCFEDKTIIDSSMISGHFGLLDKVILGICEVGGVVHGGCFYMANANPPMNRVSGPLKLYG